MAQARGLGPHRVGEENIVLHHGVRIRAAHGAFGATPQNGFYRSADA
jgi:hypothetical protein